MAEKTSNLYRLVTFPSVYSTIQNLLGSRRAREVLVSNYYDLSQGMKVLDLGCGPADILEFLPDVEYTGIDLNPSHVEQAKKKYGTKGKFIAGDVADLTVEFPAYFDRILFSGVLHHLDDDIAQKVLYVCTKLLAAEGRIIGHEPLFINNQRIIARFLKNRDSGQNIRFKNGYQELFKDLHGNLTCHVLHNLARIPYDHIVLDWSKCSNGS